jgi:hydrogenase expression/formation protein HypE
MAEAKLPELGKIDRHFFDEVIYPHLGAKDPTVLLGPRHGVDFGVVELGDKVLVSSADPVYIAPALGWERAAWFALHILASDVAVSGIRPRYLSIDLNLPPEMSEEVLRTIWETIHREAEKLGIAIVSGHTARYAGCNYPMVGGATIFGVDDRSKLVDPRSARPGDLVIITKGPAIETTGLMSVQFPEFIEERLGPEAVKEAQGIFYQMSVVHDCAVVAETGGVHAMHDATECGVWGGLFEMAEAGEYGLRIWPERIVVQDIVAKTCAVFDIDPFKAISEGTLIAVLEPAKAEEAVAALKAEGIPASIVGEVVPREEGTNLIYPDHVEPLVHPKVDPFWIRFEEYLLKQSQRRSR